MGPSLSRPLLLRSTGSRCAGSVVVSHGLSCSAACRIFPDQGSNLCPLHWQADSQPLRHQGSPSKPLWLLELYEFKMNLKEDLHVKKIKIMLIPFINSFINKVEYWKNACNLESGRLGIKSELFNLSVT